MKTHCPRAAPEDSATLNTLCLRAAPDEDSASLKTPCLRAAPEEHNATLNTLCLHAFSTLKGRPLVYGKHCLFLCSTCAGEDNHKNNNKDDDGNNNIQGAYENKTKQFNKQKTKTKNEK